MVDNQVNWRERVNFFWIFTESFECFSKVRYRQEDQACTVRRREDGKREVTFKEPQRAITPGQSIVVYKDWGAHRLCLGGAVISQRGENYFEMGKPLTTSSLGHSSLDLSFS